MNILWVSHFLLFPETGFGALQRSRNLLIELAKRHRVTLLSYYRDVDLQAIPDIETARRDLEHVCEHVELLYLPFSIAHKVRTGIESMLSGRPHSVELYRTTQLMRRVEELVRTRRIDVLHVDTLGLLDDVIRTLPVPVKALTHHNVESQMMFRRAQNELVLFKRWAYFYEATRLRRYEQRVCPLYDLNLMVSELDAVILRKNVPQLRSAVVPNGVNCQFFSFAERPSASRALIFTGGLDWYPNADAIRFICAKVWSELRTRHPDATFDIIGRNPPSDIQHLVQSCPGVRLLGYVPDVRPYIRGARIFLCPIHDGGGTRLKILDALAQGVPIVGTQIACEGLGMKHGEHVLYAETPQECVTMIDRLLSDEALCRHLSVTGRRFVEQHYSFDVIGKHLSDTYQRMLEERKG